MLYVISKPNHPPSLPSCVVCSVHRSSKICCSAWSVAFCSIYLETKFIHSLSVLIYAGGAISLLYSISFVDTLLKDYWLSRSRYPLGFYHFVRYLNSCHSIVYTADVSMNEFTVVPRFGFGFSKYRRPECFDAVPFWSRFLVSVKG
jgi:hypothetical protein